MTDPDWPLHLVLSGLPDMKSFLEAHDTLRRRVRFVEFAPVDPKRDRTQIERAIEKVAGVSLALARDPETCARICHAASRQLGLIFELTVGAIGNCLKTRRKVVTRQDYADGYASRTLEPIELNPFEVDHWETIDTSIIQRRPAEPEEVAGKPQRRRSKDNA